MLRRGKERELVFSIIILPSQPLPSIEPTI
jgi:hypothetical protein